MRFPTCLPVAPSDMEATVREKIFPSKSEVFKDELEEIAVVLMTDELTVIYSDKFSDKVQSTA